MGFVATENPWRFLLRPWRYDFEYARAWRELDFPLYGIAHPTPTVLRMGGKGRRGVIPPRPVRYLPPGLWTKLTSLGVVVEGPDWQVELDTSTPPSEVHPMVLEHACQHHAQHGSYTTDMGKGQPVAVSLSLKMDGTSVRFDGFGLDAVWVGSARTSSTTITVTATNTQADEIRLTQITDPGPYLQGQRAFMRN